MEKQIRRIHGCISICLLFISILHFANSSSFGRICPKYPSMPKFNITSFLGTWYEVERTFYLPELASSCTALIFQEDSDRSSEAEKILSISINSINHWTGSPSQNAGSATLETPTSSIMDFQFHSRLPNALSRWLPGAGRYQVLFTDYDNFAILWSCSSFGTLGYTDQIWLLGRNRTDFVLDVRSTIHDTLIKLGLDVDRLVLSKNEYCPE